MQLADDLHHGLLEKDKEEEGTASRDYLTLAYARKFAYELSTSDMYSTSYSTTSYSTAPTFDDQRAPYTSKGHGHVSIDNSASPTQTMGDTSQTLALAELHPSSSQIHTAETSSGTLENFRSDHPTAPHTSSKAVDNRLNAAPSLETALQLLHGHQQTLHGDNAAIRHSVITFDKLPPSIAHSHRRHSLWPSIAHQHDDMRPKAAYLHGRPSTTHTLDVQAAKLNVIILKCVEL